MAATLTFEQLVAADVCKEGLNTFVELFGAEVEVTNEIVREHCYKYPWANTWNWFADQILDSDHFKLYMNKVTRNSLSEERAMAWAHCYNAQMAAIGKKIRRTPSEDPAGVKLKIEDLINLSAPVELMAIFLKKCGRETLVTRPWARAMCRYEDFNWYWMGENLLSPTSQEKFHKYLQGACSDLPVGTTPVVYQATKFAELYVKDNNRECWDVLANLKKSELEPGKSVLHLYEKDGSPHPLFTVELREGRATFLQHTPDCSAKMTEWDAESLDIDPKFFLGAFLKHLKGKKKKRSPELEDEMRRIKESLKEWDIQTRMTVENIHNILKEMKKGD